MLLATLAADTPATAPGWGKLAALVLTGVAFFAVMAAYDRFKRVRAGEEIDPFSSEGDIEGQTTKPQVTTSIRPVEKGSQKGSGKGFSAWLRKK